MRMAGAVTLGVLIIEILLVGAFLLGFFWLDGWQWGMLFAAVMLLLIVLPWVGELKLVFDSAGPRGAVRVGWWGRASFAIAAEETRLLVRVLGIPIRRRFPSKPKEEPPKKPETAETAPPPEPAEGVPREEVPVTEGRTAEEVAEETPKAERPDRARKLSRLASRLDSETIEAGCRVLGSALGATCELVWGAEEIRVGVQDPVEQSLADSALEQVIGCREVGPLELSVSTGSGERRIWAIYRIGLLRAALAGVQMVIDGRLPAFAKQMKKKRSEPQVQAIDGDQRIIEKIVEQQGAACKEDEG